MKRRRRKNRMPKGMGTVYELKDKDRYGEPTHRSKPFVWYLKGKYMGSFKTREEAELTARLYNQNHKESDDITFSKVWEMWLENKGDTVSEHTRKAFASKYRTYCEPLYNKPFKELRPKDYMDVINSQPNTSNGTKNNTIKFLRAMDRFAYEMDITEKKYTENLETFKVEPVRKNRIFTEEEIRYLWDHLEIQDVDLVLILLYTGLRPGELPVIRLEDIYNDHLIGGSKTEAGRDRYIPIHPKIKKLIENRIDQSKGVTLLNYQYKALGERFRKLMKKLNWVHHLHECRHTFITRMDNAGANRVCIDLIVGHKSSNVGENVYTHKSNKQLHEAIELLD